MAITAHCFRAALNQHFRRWPRSYSTYINCNVPKKGDKVVVGMSGGVDSSVTAKLLADQDFDLSAVYMRNWDTRDESGTDKGCEWEKDWEDVQQVCKVLDIPCQMIDLSREYWNRIFEPSLRQWEVGVTPNPDVWCNREIKFGALLEHLPATDYPWFATGHYARKTWSTPTQHTPSRPKLLRATHHDKDQCYYLSSISEAGLRRALFPLGDLSKPQVRELASKHRLPTAERPESMGLCFIGEKTKFSDFISSYIPPHPGPIIDLTTGITVGRHGGLWTYTIGENAKIGGMAMKMFVAKKDIRSNIIYVVPGSNHEALFATDLHIRVFSWIWADSPPIEIQQPGGFRAYIKYRHRMDQVACTVFQSPERPEELRVDFDEPQKSIAPGQVAALWDAQGEWCLGCGVIVRASSEPPVTAGEGEGDTFKKIQKETVKGDKVIEEEIKKWQWWK